MMKDIRSHPSIMVALAGLGLIFTLPHLVSVYLVSIFILIGIYGIAATGLNILLGNTGQVSLGQAAFYGIGAYTSALLTARLSIPFAAALPLSGITAAILGYAVGLTSVRLRHSYLAMATVAFNEIFVVVIDQWTDLTGGVGGMGGISRPVLFGQRLDDTGYFYLVWIVLPLILLFNRNIIRSRMGGIMAAVREDETAAAALGIHVSRYKLKIFTLSAFYTGVAGCLFAHYSRYIGPGSFHVHFSIALLIMVLIGGSRHELGGIFGAAVVVFLPEFLSFVSKLPFLPETARSVFSEYSYHLVIYGVLLFLIAAFMPGGLVRLTIVGLEGLRSRRINVFAGRGERECR
ncbi:MAG: branched-chain amino acid ABC transporter permease [Thermodesulfobacteriota bacterium]